MGFENWEFGKRFKGLQHGVKWHKEIPQITLFETGAVIRYCSATVSFFCGIDRIK
jgi:hypothetical protein